MARSGSLSRRIERLLNDHTFRQSFAGGSRSLVAVVLLPLALVAATTMVRVQAAAHNPTVASIEPCGQAVCSTAEPDNVATEAESAATMTAVSAEGASIEMAAQPTEATVAAPATSAQSESENSIPFDRTLTAGEATQLLVSTGSGNIHLKQSSGSQIHIHGDIRVNHEGSEEQARQIAANPPIEQSGNVIKVGQQHEEHWRGISINYEIEAPAGTVLGATSGSGDIVDEGVGQNAKLETGSGDIRASGLKGTFIVKTGSGNINADQIGEGDVKAETGSGNIEIKDIHGSFRGETGSGDIKASGTPSAPWTLETGSGNIEIFSGNAGITLDASTGSGSVTTDHEMLVKGSLDHHHISGNLNGGGPTVRAQTGSGDIHVH